MFVQGSHKGAKYTKKKTWCAPWPLWDIRQLIVNISLAQKFYGSFHSLNIKLSMKDK